MKKPNKTIKEKLLRAIPVLGPYKVEEQLREWDNSIRSEAVQHLTNIEESLMSMLEIAVDKRDRAIINEIERSRKNVHATKEKIRITEYGYFPRFSPIKIHEEDLLSMLDIDEEIVDKSQSLSEKVAFLSTSFDEREKESILELQLLRQDLRSIGELVSKRTLLLRKGMGKEGSDEGE